MESLHCHDKTREWNKEAGEKDCFLAIIITSPFGVCGLCYGSSKRGSQKAHCGAPDTKKKAQAVRGRESATEKKAKTQHKLDAKGEGARRSGVHVNR